jgi:hypothetical protein
MVRHDLIELYLKRGAAQADTITLAEIPNHLPQHK